MKDIRLLWAAVGLGAAVLGGGLSELAAGALTLRTGPLSGFGVAVGAVLPDEFVVHNGIDLVALVTGPVMAILLLLTLGSLAVAAGAAAAESWRRPVVVTAVVAGIGVVCELLRPDPTLVDLVPVLVGALGFLLALAALTALMARRPDVARAAELSGDAATDPPVVPSRTTRRTVLAAAGFAALAGVVASVAGDALGRSRRAVEQGRRLLRLTMVSSPQPPPDVEVGLGEVAEWMTPSTDFYRHDQAVVVPAIAAEEWTLRIHGDVEREVLLTYADLIDMTVQEQWSTLVGLTYEPGGEQVGNAWWSGVPTHVLLERAGVLPGADVVVQTGGDGWQCVTSTQVLGDPGRRAVLAFAMNGEALPLEHGFPARTLVPGLYGGVSACKWVTDWQVARLDAIEGEWDENRPLRAPVRIAARIDVPAGGDEVAAGTVQIGGVAWAPPIGVGAVEVSVDGGGWGLAVLAAADETDSWAQWRADLDLGPGRHLIRVRARDRVGTAQEEEADDADATTGGIGIHEIEIEVVAEQE